MNEMDPQTAFVLTIQLLALFSIAGALLLYLICKIRGTRTELIGQQSGSILITSADSALGLQLCTHFANKGCRVFAGMKEPEESLPAKLLLKWKKDKENCETPILGSIVPLKLDITREDILKESIEAIGAYLNARENGIMAILNTAGFVHRGKIDTQDFKIWENMFKINVLGSLRVARAFLGLLRPNRGRIIYFGAGSNENGLVAFNASRSAIEGYVSSLRDEWKMYGINVIAIDSNGISPESLYKAPILYATSDERGNPTQYSAAVLTLSALSTLEKALWDVRPNHRYNLVAKKSKFKVKIPYRNSCKLKHITSDV